MTRISIQELAGVLTEKNGLSKAEAEKFVTAMFSVIKEGTNRDKLTKVRGLGTFKVITVEARESINVNSGERFLIEGRDKITFTPDAAVKEIVNKPFSHFETVVLNEGVTFDDMDDTKAAIDVVGATEEIVPEADTKAEESSTAKGIMSDNFAISLVEEAEPEEIIPEESETEAIAPAVGEPLAEEKIEEPEVTSVETSEAEPEEEQNEPEEEPEEELATEPDIEPETESDSETEAETTELDQEEDLADDTQDEQEEPSEQTEEEVSRKWPLWILAIVLGIAAFAGVGYFVGQNASETEKTVAQAQPKAEKKTVEKVTEKPVQRTEKTTEKSAEQATVTTHVEQPAPQKAQDEGVPQKYDAMDVRVRTGAYVILGLERIEKARGGETLTTFSKRLLGPGMECYVEVFNGRKGTDILTKGEDIKIPKLLLRKTWKKRMEQ